MFIRNVVRVLAALLAAVAAMVVGVVTAVACQPKPESVGRSGIWASLPPLEPTILPAAGLTDWVVAAGIVLAATATLAIRDHDDVRHA